MNDFESMVDRQRKWMFSLMAIFLLGAVLTPYDRIFLGLLLGNVISYYSLRLLQNRIKRFGETVIEGRSARGFGTLFRIGGAVLAVYIAIRFEDKFHMIAVIFGLATSYIVILAESIFRSIADSKNES